MKLLSKLFYFARSLTLYLCIAILSIIWVPLLYLVYPIKKHACLSMLRLWTRIVGLLTRMICGIKTKIYGMENITQTPVIFFSKHQSAWETLNLLHLLPTNCFILKESLLKIPFFGWGLRTGQPIAIDRSKGMRAIKSIIKQGKRRLASGLCIVVFPEGTRVAPHTHPQFHKGGATLAKQSGYPVIPIAHDAGHCWPARGFIKYPGTIHIHIGPLIKTVDKSTDEINTLAYNWIKDNMIALEKMEG